MVDINKEYSLYRRRMGRAPDFQTLHGRDPTPEETRELLNAPYTKKKVKQIPGFYSIKPK
jgi:hypothetical protein